MSRGRIAAPEQSSSRTILLPKNIPPEPPPLGVNTARARRVSRPPRGPDRSIGRSIPTQSDVRLPRRVPRAQLTNVVTLQQHILAKRSVDVEGRAEDIARSFALSVAGFEARRTPTPRDARSRDRAAGTSSASLRRAVKAAHRPPHPPSPPWRRGEGTHAHAWSCCVPRCPPDDHDEPIVFVFRIFECVVSLVFEFFVFKFFEFEFFGFELFVFEFFGFEFVVFGFFGFEFVVFGFFGFEFFVFEFFGFKLFVFELFGFERRVRILRFRIILCIRIIRFRVTARKARG